MRSNANNTTERLQHTHHKRGIIQLLNLSELKCNDVFKSKVNPGVLSQINADKMFHCASLNLNAIYAFKPNGRNYIIHAIYKTSI